MDNYINTLTEEFNKQTIDGFEQYFNTVTSTFLSDITNKIIIDIHTKINNSNNIPLSKITYIDDPNLLTGPFGCIKLSKNERYIVFIEKQLPYYSNDTTNYLMFRVTNYGNISVCERTVTNRYNQQTNHMGTIKCIKHDILLSDMFILMVQSISPHIINIDAIDKFITIYKENYFRFLVSSDLQQKCINLTSEINILKKECTERDDQINSLKNKLKECIPIENQCCICFGYTKKNQALVPCGHTQYCNECIVTIKTCSICITNTVQVIKIF